MTAGDSELMKDIAIISAIKHLFIKNVKLIKNSIVIVRYCKISILGFYGKFQNIRNFDSYS